MDEATAAVAATYNENPLHEWNRLERDAYHTLEFTVTWHYLRKYLPAQGKVLDAGGGPGRYTLALCRSGYEVVLYDLSQGELELAKEKFRAEPQEVQQRLSAVVQGDLRDMAEFSDRTFDAVLCLGGPLSHIPDEAGRRAATAELVRVVKPGAIVCLVGVGRLAVLRWVMAHLSDDLLKPSFQRLVETGDDFGPTGSIWHFFRADELRQLAEEQGLETLAMAGCQGLSSGLDEATNAVAADPVKWGRWVETIIRTSAEAAVVDLAEHILYVGRRREGLS